MTPAQRSLRARLGGLATKAAGHVNVGPARRSFYERFEREVDPEGVLAPEERARRAEYARKAHMARLALKSSIARSKKGARNARRSSDQPTGEDQRGGSAGVPVARQAVEDVVRQGEGGTGRVRVRTASAVRREPEGSPAADDAARAHVSYVAHSRRTFRWRDFVLEEGHPCDDADCPAPYPGVGSIIFRETPGLVEVARFTSWGAGKRALRALAAERFAKMLNIGITSARDWIDW